MDALQHIAQDCMKKELPALNIGDTVKVHVKIKEGDISETFTVRRVSHGCGVERVFPVHSPNIEKVELVRSGKVRRSKLYYLRDRVGKAAKVKEAIR